MLSCRFDGSWLWFNTMFLFHMPEELSCWSTTIPFCSKKYKFGFISIDLFWTALHTVHAMSLLRIFDSSFASEIIPDIRCTSIVWIWMIICDIIHNYISCLGFRSLCLWCALWCSSSSNRRIGHSQIGQVWAGQQKNKWSTRLAGAVMLRWVSLQCSPNKFLFIEVRTLLCSSSVRTANTMLTPGTSFWTVLLTFKETVATKTALHQKVCCGINHLNYTLLLLQGLTPTGPLYASYSESGHADQWAQPGRMLWRTGNGSGLTASASLL